MNAPTGIYVIRHGKTSMNSTDTAEDLIRGWRNVPLDEQGEREAKSAITFIKTLHPARIYSSDLDRAADTARDAAQVCKCPVIVTKALRPWGLGSYQGKPAKDVVPQLQSYIDNPDKPVPGGGESFNQFKSRVLGYVRGVMKEYQRDEENLVLLSHFRVLKLLQAWLAKGGLDDIDAKVFAANDINTGSGLVLRRSRGKWTATKHAMNTTQVGIRST